MEFDKSFKPRKPKTREVSSRFRSPAGCNSTSGGNYSQVNPMPCQSQILSPLKQMPRSSKGMEKSGFMKKLWPSSFTASQNSSLKVRDLAGRREEEEEDDGSNYPAVLSRQMSCLEFSRFAGEGAAAAKENQRPLFGGSVRYTGKFATPARSSTSPSSSSSSSSNFSNLLEDYSDYRKRSDFLSDLESEDSEVLSSNSFTSPAVVGKNSNFTPSYMAPTVSSKKSAGIEVSSKYLQDPPSRSRRWSADSGAQKNRVENSPKTSGALKRSSSVKPASPSLRRSNSAAITPESRGKLLGFQSSMPPTNPSRVKGVGSFFSMGLELLKVKKSSSSSSNKAAAAASSSSAEAENIHRLRMLHNRLMQWRYVNGKSDAVNEKINKEAQRKLICAEEGIAKLRHSVIQKKLQLQKEKLDMKLTFLLHSQMKQLEEWGEMETQHTSSICMTKESLNSVVCNVPIIHGAKVDIESTSIVLQDASNLAASIEWTLSAFSPGANQAAEVMKELAEVVTQEKLLLEECLELFKTTSRLEIEERSLRCNLIQLRLQQQEEFCLSAM
ncbi:unnamed protein product [Cuscuta campestris]|uniref:QWRF motif-containing protein 3 n=1 Tax=Cuscuta campestris TaxID=132261 RepID=A0A484MB46_9ASTE|nr:unnamed protein product [Cuscuta campestris]